MAVELKVPEAGESITEVEIAEWLKSKGEKVERDEPVVTLETDKATLELPAPVSGTITEMVKEAGEIVEVGEVIGYMEEGEPEPPGDEEKEERAKAEKKRADAKKRAPAGEEPEEAVEDEGDEENDTGEDKGKQKHKGKQKERKPERRRRKEAPREDAREEDAEEAGVRARVAPAARRILEKHGLSADEVDATGPGGRLLKEDVLRYLSELEKDEGQETLAADAETSVREAERHDELVAMSPMRRRIAERLVEAKQQSALLTTFNEIDMTRVIELRRTFQEAFRKSYEIKLGFMSFFVKAVVEALRDVPQLNAELRGTDIAYRHYYDIGIAVGGGKGLVVPVLRSAERMSFAEIERAIADFARRARAKDLKLEELQGGTFTISNGGVYGSLLSTPIVNPPQSGILGLHAIQERPVARDGEVLIRPMMYVAVTYDHRIVDGREAVTFLRRIKETIEEPSRILMEV